MTKELEVIVVHLVGAVLAGGVIGIERSYHARPAGFRTRRMRVLGPQVREIAPVIEEQKFRQYLFFRQWAALRAYCNGLGVSVMGDLPCYVHHDSADVWGNPALFKLDPEGRPAYVAGVPPDYFSRTGQLWGNPGEPPRPFKAGEQPAGGAAP